jgi:hypothetical protein
MYIIKNLLKIRLFLQLSSIGMMIEEIKKNHYDNETIIIIDRTPEIIDLIKRFINKNINDQNLSIRDLSNLFNDVIKKFEIMDDNIQKLYKNNEFHYALNALPSSLMKRKIDDVFLHLSNCEKEREKEQEFLQSLNEKELTKKFYPEFYQKKNKEPKIKNFIYYLERQKYIDSKTYIIYLNIFSDYLETTFIDINQLNNYIKNINYINYINYNKGLSNYRNKDNFDYHFNITTTINKETITEKSNAPKNNQIIFRNEQDINIIKALRKNHYSLINERIEKEKEIAQKEKDKTKEEQIIFVSNLFKLNREISYKISEYVGSNIFTFLDETIFPVFKIPVKNLKQNKKNMKQYVFWRDIDKKLEERNYLINNNKLIIKLYINNNISKDIETKTINEITEAKRKEINNIQNYLKETYKNLTTIEFSIDI